MGKKFVIAKKILEFFQVIDSRGKITSFCKTNLHRYGNLGSISYNYALNESETNGCSYEMIAIISFLMFGSNILFPVVSIIPANDKHSSGDIMSIASFLIQLSNKINLKLIKEEKIYSELNKIHLVQGKPWTPTLVRVLR